MIEEIIRLLVDNELINTNNAEIDENDDLIDLGLDSFNCIQLIVLLEDTYSIEFNDDDLSLETVSSVSKIVDYILKQREEIK